MFWLIANDEPRFILKLIANIAELSLYTNGTTSMRNIVGQMPRGEYFFPRDKIINLIYRRLNFGVIDNYINYFKLLSKELHHLKSLTKKSLDNIKYVLYNYGVVNM